MHQSTGHIRQEARRSAERAEAARSQEKSVFDRILERRKALGILAAAAVALPIYTIARGNESTTPNRTVTVHYGDTLSEIADDELQKQGIEDPTTQEINGYVTKMSSANPDEITGSAAGVGEVLELPKK